MEGGPMEDSKKQRMDDAVKSVFSYATPALLTLIGVLLLPIVQAVPKMQQDLAVLTYQVKDTAQLHNAVLEHEAKIAQLESAILQQQRTMDEILHRLDGRDWSRKGESQQ